MAFTITIGPLRAFAPTRDEAHPLGAGEPGESPAPVPSSEPSAVPAAPSEPWFSALTALGTFLRARRASVSVATLLTVTVMVVLCGGLIAIAHEAHSQDRMDRAARAAARAIALLPPSVAADQRQLNAVICDVLRIEFDLDQQNDCSGVGPIDVATDLTTVDLAGVTQSANANQGANGNAGGAPPQTYGEMILVRIGSGQALIRREPAS